MSANNTARTAARLQCVFAAGLALATVTLPTSAVAGEGWLQEALDVDWVGLALEEPIETDRHDFTEAVSVVGAGVTQFEYGYTYFYADIEDEIDSKHALPELTLRYGLSDNTEFKVRWNSLWQFGEEDDLLGAEDMRLTFKVLLREQMHVFPEVAVQLRSSVPTGGSNVTVDKFNAGINLIYEWEFGHDWKLAGSTGVAENGLGDVALFDAELGEVDNSNAWHQSLALGVPFGPRNEAYFEWFGLWSDGLRNEYVQHYFNIGIDHLVTDNVVVDVRIGKGLSADSDDLFVGVGGGLRF